MPRKIAETFDGDVCPKCGNSLRYRSDSRCVHCRLLWSRSTKRKNYLQKYWQEPEHKAKLRASTQKWNRSQWGKSVMLWHYAKSRAKGDFTITPTDIEKKLVIAEEKWKRIGIEFQYSGNNGNRMYSPSVDQIEAGRGYTPENIQIVPWVWNAMRGNSLTNEETIEFCKKVAKAFEEGMSDIF
jgi:hypothetical protein